ncbi:hypothetical protein DUI87_09248 [Hirundo rustica rustica]|uniref:Uncharacterized protein n=1 Tax=Hirundo rustica rustica TaxID=333673 RepID=A0A3M0KLM8_HIRRU|nr:hypothetical protein DUI87_09248 [Hirundo rustica rustica]
MASPGLELGEVQPPPEPPQPELAFTEAQKWIEDQRQRNHDESEKKGFCAKERWAAKTLSDECLDLQGSRNFGSTAPEALGVLSFHLESVTFHQRWSSGYHKPSFSSASITLVWMLQFKVV